MFKLRLLTTTKLNLIEGFNLCSACLFNGKVLVLFICIVTSSISTVLVVKLTAYYHHAELILDEPPWLVTTFDVVARSVAQY